ncbi:Type II inositol 3,4-bisphosphate 4-phosphatase isoform X2 [Oopsacas minuta]|uniref:Type II inositol 3,4-bisphosphate 4-phosphatase isoform X2 n=1 Tax=Oopsacas minuta TaxID=111878 RepID=A0AAV7JT27_9METZ|nr:Type II inositol 3,4-bisphosphate 4-phosphatase isoform X2 [Oopsacas minuta]
MRFNEKELIALANSKTFTIEGILWKRPKLGIQYKDRFCRLKDNLLFYFTVNSVIGIDGIVQKQRCGDLLGVVVTENMVIQELGSDQKHPDQMYGFCIYYRSQQTDSLIPPKLYEFRCGSREIQRCWMDCLNKSSFSSLRRHYTYIQNEFISLNIDLPPESIRFQDRSSKVTFSNIQTLVPRGKSSICGVCCSPPVPVKKLLDIDLLVRGPCTYSPKRPDSKGIELKLSCSNLIAYHNVGYYVDVSAGNDKQKSLDLISRTETIYNTSRPSYCSTILLDKDKYLSNKCFLTFLIKQVLNEDTDLGIDISILILHKARLAVSELFLNGKIDLMTEDGKACVTVKTLKPITALYFKPQKFYEKFYKHLHCVNYCTQRSPCDMLFLNPLYLFPMRKTYELPLSAHRPVATIRAMEVTAESPYNNIIPIEYLKMCLRDNKNICSDLISLGTLLSGLEIHKEQLATQLEEQIVHYNATINELVELQFFFHASSKRYNTKLSFLPINLHVQKLISVNELPFNPHRSPIKDDSTHTPPALRKSLPITRTMTDTSSPSHGISNTRFNTLSYVTMGAPTHHVVGFDKGSLLTMLRESNHLPFFVFSDHNLARRYVELADELADCLYQFTEYKDFLFRTLANTAFNISQDALTGLSRTMQRMFTVLESSEVQQGICLFHQLTANSMITQPSVLPNPAIQDSIQKPDKTVDKSIRHSWYPGIGNKLDLALPKSADLINPTKRTMESKLSYRQRQASILHDYIELAKKVDMTSANITNMREHLADLSQLGLLSSTKIELISWTDELIPLTSKILVKLNKLYLTAKNGLTLKRLDYESSIKNYVEMLERHDVIMSQLVTCLVTSFAQALQTHAESFNHTARMTSFIKKCTSIGYLFCVDSYLNVINEEKYMHEDLAIGIQQLSAVKIRLTCGCCHDHPEITGSRTNFKILIPICSGYYKIIPATLRESDITIYPLLFSRSVFPSANQTEKVSAYEFIASTNKQSILALKTYYDICEKNKMEFVTNPLTNKVYILDKLMSKLSAKNFTSKFTNIYDMQLFQLVEQATRELEGGMVIMCKSAKDRTGCAATLQQAQFLKDTYSNIISEDEKQTILNAMRMTGTKLDVCAKNTNISLFAFNPKNMLCLPPSLIPPMEVCGRDQIT